MAAKRSSEFIGPAVRALREQRGWRQQDFVDRLSAIGMQGWRQSKITKLESGEQKRVTIDELLELAAGLGCSPLWLVSPEIDDDEGAPVDVRIGSNHVRPAGHIRDWIRGYAPLFAYRDERQGEQAAKFYFFDSQPLSEWLRHRGNRELDERMREAIEAMPGWRQDALKARRGRRLEPG